MKKNVLRVLAVVLTAVLAFTVVHFAVLGNNTPVDTTFTFAVENGNAVLTGASDALSGAVMLPAELDGKTVVAIGADAFKDCTNVTAFFLPDTVTSIGSYAFENCTSLAQMILPESLAEIGEGAFWNCESLLSVTVPANVGKVGSCAFYGCDALESVIVPGTATKTQGMFNVALDIGQYIAISNPAREALDPIHTTVYCYNGSAAHSAALKDGYCAFALLDDCTTTSYTVRYVDENSTSLYAEKTLSVQPVGIRVAAVAAEVSDDTVLYPDADVQTITLTDAANTMTFVYAPVPETTTEEPTTEEPTTEEPTTEEPTTEEPTTEEPTTEEPTTEKELVAPTLFAREGSGAVLDRENGYLYGVDIGVNYDTMIRRYLEVRGDGHVVISEDSKISTGCTVSLVSDIDGQVVENFTVIVFGDLNGDSVFNSTDLSLMKGFIAGTIKPSDMPYAYFASDLFVDSVVNSSDLTYLKALVARTMKFDQATRLPLANND